MPPGDGWAYEFKWDGVRALLDVSEAGVRLTSRAGNDVSAGYPELVAQAAEVGDALLDGEIVAFVDGGPSFERLQSRMHLRAKSDVARAAADCRSPSWPSTCCAASGSTSPRARTPSGGPRSNASPPSTTDGRCSPSFDDGPATEAVARANGLEGVVAKRVASVYRPGQRSDDWRKLRFVRAGDFAVIGWEAAAEHPTR